MQYTASWFFVVITISCCVRFGTIGMQKAASRMRTDPPQSIDSQKQYEPLTRQSKNLA